MKKLVMIYNLMVDFKNKKYLSNILRYFKILLKKINYAFNFLNKKLTMKLSFLKIKIIIKILTQINNNIKLNKNNKFLSL